MTFKNLDHSSLCLSTVRQLLLENYGVEFILGTHHHIKDRYKYSTGTDAHAN